MKGNVASNIHVTFRLMSLIYSRNEDGINKLLEKWKERKQKQKIIAKVADPYLQYGDI